jgi:hypothetical protein
MAMLTATMSKEEEKKKKQLVVVVPHCSAPVHG